MNLERFHKLLSALYPEDHAGTPDAVNDIDAYLQYEHSFLLSLDWTGESEQGELQRFIAGCARRLGSVPPQLEAVDALDDASESGRFRRGELIFMKLKTAGIQLKPQGFELCLINDQSDQYHVFLVPSAEFTSVSECGENDVWFIECCSDLVEPEEWPDAVSPMEPGFYYQPPAALSPGRRVMVWFSGLDVSTKISFGVSAVMALLLLILKLRNQ